jgi:hypothetical protein
MQKNKLSVWKKKYWTRTVLPRPISSHKTPPYITECGEMMEKNETTLLENPTKNFSNKAKEIIFVSIIFVSL